MNTIDIRANFARLENGFSQQYEIMNVAGTKFDLIGGMRGSLRNVFFVRQISTGRRFFAKVTLLFLLLSIFVF